MTSSTLLGSPQSIRAPIDNGARDSNQRLRQLFGQPAQSGGESPLCH